MTNTRNNIHLSLNVTRRVLLLLCITCICYLLTGAIAWFVTLKGGITAPILRILAVVQDVILFILPALVTAMLVTRLPARLLAIDKSPSWTTAFLACLGLISAMPILNALIAWNESITLPSSMAGIEESMRSAEAAAQASVAILIGGDSIGSLIVSILIVGILAGLSEELYFRGALQRIMSADGKLNVHAAIFIAAFVFSFFHFQFYGFFPRLLLGVYFGYLLYWSGSLWIPVIVHAFNNTICIIGTRMTAEQASAPIDINTVGADNIVLVIISIVLTAGIIFCIYNQSRKRDVNPS